MEILAISPAIVVPGREIRKGPVTAIGAKNATLMGYLATPIGYQRDIEFTPISDPSAL
jgi:hypothetical protein